MSGGRSVLRDPEFLKYWTGQSISMVGSQFTLLALPITAAVVLRASAAEMGFLTALEFAPALLLGLVAGVWLDRVRRRPVLVATQVAGAVVLASVPVVAVLHALTIPQLYAVAFLAGTASVVQTIAQGAFLPTLAGRDRLLEANARQQTSMTVAALIGPGLAGAAIQLLTAPMAIAVDAASFVLGAATSAWVRVTEPAVARTRRPHPLREAVAGFEVLLRQPLVAGITGTLLIANAGGAMTTAVFVLLFVGQFGIAPATLGLVFVASSASSLAGSLVVRPLQRRTGVGPVMLLATTLLAAGVTVRVAAAYTPHPLVFPILVASSLISGFGLMTYNIPQQAIRQAVIPNHLLGRAAAATALAVYFGSVTGSLLGGLLGQALGLRWAFVAATVVTVLCVVPTAVSPLRRLREVPVAQG